VLSERDLLAICRIDRQLASEEPRLAAMFASHAALADRRVAEVDEVAEVDREVPARRRSRPRAAATAAAWAAVFATIAVAVLGGAMALCSAATGMAQLMRHLG
jgi:hypothetical protein